MNKNFSKDTFFAELVLGLFWQLNRIFLSKFGFKLKMK